MRCTYSHGYDEVARALPELANTRYGDGREIRYEELDNKDDGDNTELDQFGGGELGCQLSEDYRERISYCSTD